MLEVTVTSSDGIVTAEAAVSHVVPLCKSRSVGRAKYGRVWDGGEEDEM